MKLLRNILLTLPLIVAALSGCKDMGSDPFGGFGTQTRRIVNRIFFLSNRETARSQQLFSMNPDGSDIRRITYPSDSISYSQVSHSPDMTRMAVVWNFFDLRHREQPPLAIADASGKILYQLSDYCSGKISWSPNGDLIAFTKTPIIFGGDADIYIVNAGGGAIKKVTNYRNGNTVINFMKWIDNTRMLVNVGIDSAGSFTKSGVYEIDLTGSILGSVKEGGDSIYVPWLTVSPDKRKTAYVYFRRGRGYMGVRVADFNSTVSRSIVPELYLYGGDQYNSDISWSPLSDMICFSSRQGFSSSPPPSITDISKMYVYNEVQNTLAVVISDSIRRIGNERPVVNFVAEWR